MAPAPASLPSHRPSGTPRCAGSVPPVVPWHVPSAPSCAPPRTHAPPTATARQSGNPNRCRSPAPCPTGPPPAAVRSCAQPYTAGKWSGYARSATPCLHRRDGPGPHRQTGAEACAGSLPTPGHWTGPLRTGAGSDARGYAAKSSLYRDAAGRLVHEPSAQALQPAIETTEGITEGAIELQRGNRDIALHHRMKVGARAAVFGIARGGDPITFLATWVDHLQRRRGTGAMAQARELDAANMLDGQIGDIDVKHRPRRQIEGTVGFHQLARKIGGSRQVIQLARGQREGERGPTQEAPFKGCRHGTGIQHVISQVGTKVDARHHQIRLLIQQTVDRQVYAVGGGAVHADKAIGQNVHVQRTVERQRTAGAALVLVGGNHHALGVIRQRSMKRGEARCGGTVVI